MGDNNTNKNNSRLPAAHLVPSEFLVAKRWDFCRDAILRSTGYGTLYGALSLFIFGKRWMRLFGVAAGAGVGFGLGVAECRASFVRPSLYDPTRVKVVPQGTTHERSSTHH